MATLKFASYQGADIPMDDAGAVERRKLIWHDALARCYINATASLRLRKRHNDAKVVTPQLVAENIDLVAGYQAADQMAIISLVTMFNSGHGVEGLIAGNTSDQAVYAREEALNAAFPTRVERQDFDEFLKRLVTLRNTLLAHQDGGAQEFEQEGTRISFRPDIRISEVDVNRLANVAMKLIQAICPGGNPEREH